MAASALVLGGLVVWERAAPQTGTLYATYSSMDQAEERDYEQIAFQPVEVHGAEGTLAPAGALRTLELADRVRLAFSQEEGLEDRWAEGKGTAEWKKSIFSFLGWPMLRAQSYPGQTDYLEVTLVGGKVTQLRWKRTETAEPKTVNRLPWELSQSPAQYPDENMTLGYGLTVEEPMDFTMAVERWAGEFSFAVKEADTYRYAYEKRSLDRESDTFHLEPGEYLVELGLDHFYGSYRLTGETAEK